MLLPVALARYRVDAPIDTGTFSRIYRATSLSHGRAVCLKLVRRNAFDEGLSELNVYARLRQLDPEGQHPVLRQVDAFYFQEHLFLVTELLGPSLFAHYVHLAEQGTRAQVYTARTVARVVSQVLDALCFLHEHGITHGDVKTANVCYVDVATRQVKLIDFNSVLLPHNVQNSYHQSRYYRAPEVALGCRHGHKIDLWALGCLGIELGLGWILYQV